jgi:hypothetical protein
MILSNTFRNGNGEMVFLNLEWAMDNGQFAMDNRQLSICNWQFAIFAYCSPLGNLLIANCQPQAICLLLAAGKFAYCSSQANLPIVAVAKYFGRS